MKEAQSGFYESAARALQLVLQLKGTVKAVALSERVPAQLRRSVYAILCEVLKYRELLLGSMEKVLPGGLTSFLKRERMSLEMALCLSHDLLLKRGGIKCGGRQKAAFAPHKDALAAAFMPGHAARKAQLERMLSPLPKYARVNTHLVTAEAATRALVPLRFEADEHVPNLLRFPPQTSLFEHEMYATLGHLVIQDKSSCLPAHLLDPPPGATVIDACAAPGNKTQHLSTVMQNRGRIVAFDLSSHRLRTLEALAARTQSTIIEAVCKNFLEVDPAEYPEATHVLADPSCSGSGMLLQRIDSLVPAGAQDEAARVTALAAFQESIVAHAMKFPNVRRVSYSTCSVHDEENEAVVQRVLQSHPGWRLVHALPEWKRRGHSGAGLSDADAERCIRALPEDDCSGFFVALFARGE